MPPANSVSHRQGAVASHPEQTHTWEVFGEHVFDASYCIGGGHRAVRKTDVTPPNFSRHDDMRPFRKHVNLDGRVKPVASIPVAPGFAGPKPPKRGKLFGDVRGLLWSAPEPACPLDAPALSTSLHLDGPAFFCGEDDGVSF